MIQIRVRPIESRRNMRELARNLLTSQLQPHLGVRKLPGPTAANRLAVLELLIDQRLETATGELVDLNPAFIHGFSREQLCVDGEVVDLRGE